MSDVLQTKSIAMFHPAILGTTFPSAHENLVVVY
jgi:hypothetical protein